MGDRMGVLMNDDPMDDAYRMVRGLPRQATDTQMAGTSEPVSATERWLGLEKKRRQLEADLKATVTQQDGLRRSILGRWSTDGVSSETVDGQTVHLQRKVYPKIVDRARLAEAIRKEGLDELLTVDDKAFAVFVTERDEHGEPLPDSIADLIASSFERYALVVKLTASTKSRD